MEHVSFSINFTLTRHEDKGQFCGFLASENQKESFFSSRLFFTRSEAIDEAIRKLEALKHERA